MHCCCFIHQQTIQIFVRVFAIEAAIVVTVGDNIPTLCICNNDGDAYGDLYKRR